MCRPPLHYSKHMHTPITAVQLDVSVTTQCNILLSLTYTYNKTNTVYLRQNSSWCQLTEVQSTSQLLRIKIVFSSTQAATLQTRIYHVVYFLECRLKYCLNFKSTLYHMLPIKLLLSRCQRQRCMCAHHEGIKWEQRY